MACDGRPICIFAFKSTKVEVWCQLECASQQLASMITANWHFLCCHVFPVLSELDYLLLEHVVFPDDLDFTFAFGKCYGRGALNRFLVVLILIETRAVLIMKVSPGVNIFMRWVFNFCLVYIFHLMVLACQTSNPGGGS